MGRVLSALALIVPVLISAFCVWAYNAMCAGDGLLHNSPCDPDLPFAVRLPDLFRRMLQTLPIVPNWRPCADAFEATLPYCDASLDAESRAADFIARMPLYDKRTLLTDFWPTVARRRMPPIHFWNEALHGVAEAKGIYFGGPTPHATSFPMPLCSAASFNESLWTLTGEAVSTEARAFINSGTAGYTFWTPNINILRDPRWGRGQETPGEDPLLTSRFVVRYLRALQGADDGVDMLKTSACCKHYLAYSLMEWGGSTRHNFDARVTDQDVADTYLPAFESCVKDAEATCVMCAYNRINGVPACAHEEHMSRLRGEWGFDGYITTDCYVLEDFVAEYEGQRKHGYVDTIEEGIQLSFKHGADMECGKMRRFHIKGMLDQGMVDEPTVDAALNNVVKVMMRAGAFDPTNPYSHIGPQHIDTPEHRQLALEAARQAVVLLANERKTLPLDLAAAGRVAVIGPNANNGTTLLGQYAGVPSFIDTPLDGFRKLLGEDRVAYAMGVGTNSTLEGEEGGDDALERAATLAADAQTSAVVLCLGLDGTQEAEFLPDRVRLDLPAAQKALLKAVKGAMVSTGSAAPLIVAIISGGAVDISDALEGANAAVWAGYGGQSGGLALAEVVLGLTQPSGRLPTTWYRQAFAEQVSMFDMAMRPEPSRGYPGRTYRFYDGKPLFEFGHGLTYQRISYAFNKMSLPPLSAHSLLVGDTPAHTVQLVLQNEGNVAAAEVVLLFVDFPEAAVKVGAPRRQLAAFARAELAPGESRAVALSPDPRAFTYADASGQRVAARGTHAYSFGPAREAAPISFTVRD